MIQDAGYTIPEALVSMKIYDATGMVVKDFRPTPYSLRPTQMSWDGTDQAHRQLPGGVYFLIFTIGDYAETKKLLLIR
jgi:flagellar hook assembly protein FlgD